MKKQLPFLFTYLFLLTLLTSCSVIGDIFKAGMSLGIFIVIALIVVIVFIIAKLTGKK